MKEKKRKKKEEEEERVSECKLGRKRYVGLLIYTCMWL